MATLCVNIDHIATLRQARREEEPDPLEAARLVEKAGAAGITVHLREDRRHIQDQDVVGLRKIVKTKLNLEMAATDAMVKFALKVKPDQATLVPEKRQELTTEGGLALKAAPSRFQKAIDLLQSNGIPVSLFIDPSPQVIQLSARLGASYVELHTGRYSQAFRLKGNVKKEFVALAAGARLGRSLGLRVHAGHGLTYQNVRPIAALPEIEDLNIGHNIIARASMVGLEKAVKEMLAILKTSSKF
ncbi:MAG TPA: pyridoxine 5'-phosphate synthase [bacterium]|nr:pyridoxine 5'-phosphate synthase [bacterium]